MSKEKMRVLICLQTHLEELQQELQNVEDELKVKEGQWGKEKNAIENQDSP